MAGNSTYSFNPCLRLKMLHILSCLLYQRTFSTCMELLIPTSKMVLDSKTYLQGWLCLHTGNSRAQHVRKMICTWQTSEEKLFKTMQCILWSRSPFYVLFQKLPEWILQVMFCNKCLGCLPALSINAISVGNTDLYSYIIPVLSIFSLFFLEWGYQGMNGMIIVVFVRRQLITDAFYILVK